MNSSLIVSKRGASGGFAIFCHGQWFDITTRVMSGTSGAYDDLLKASGQILDTSGLEVVENPLESGGAIIAQLLDFGAFVWCDVAPCWDEAFVYFMRKTAK